MMGTLRKLERRDFLSLCCVAPLATYNISLKDISCNKHINNPGRRVVTGINDLGKSCILSDGGVPENARYYESQKISGSVLWKEHQVPVDLNQNPETLEGYTFTLEPPHGGMTAHILTLEPGFSGEYHRTNTIDFVFIISGKLELILEEKTTMLASGDCVIQRATNHAWRVLGEEPCTLAAVMVSATRS